jgi:hypothetical protein
MLSRIPISTPTDRRIRREARSAALRAQALALRQTGKTYADIGAALGLSLERARQITLKAERLANDPRWHDSLPARAVNLLHIRGLERCPRSRRQSQSRGFPGASSLQHQTSAASLAMPWSLGSRGTDSP